MGCVSSTFLHHDDEFPQIGSSALGHHIVSLTSTTYGLLTLDPPAPAPSRPFHSSPTTPPPPAPRFTVGSVLSEPRPLRSEPEVINSWELMAGLDNDSFRFSPVPLIHRSSTPKIFSPKFDRNNENFNPNSNFNEKPSVFRPLLSVDSAQKQRASSPAKHSLDKFELLCPPNGENKVVIYTTTLRGVRKTFEACNAVRSALEGLGISFCERDISMDRGFRDELKELMKNKDMSDSVPPRVFVRGRYLGGSEEVLRIHEEGCLPGLLDGLPKAKIGEICDGCGGARFLPCFQCSGSCKIVMMVKGDLDQKLGNKTVVVRCTDCNENGLVLCPICS